ncbi:hypothetical protein [Mycobacterium gastri]
MDVHIPASGVVLTLPVRNRWLRSVVELVDRDMRRDCGAFRDGSQRLRQPGQRAYRTQISGAMGADYVERRAGISKRS